MSRSLILFAAAACLAAGCVPPELMEEDAPAEPASFEPVAELTRGSCAAVSSCHGATSPTAFAVEGDGAATDAQVRAAIEGVTTNADVPMVVPGEPEQSALYLRLVETGPKRMPPVGNLTEEQIESVRVWIADGAHYE
ncbi:hypothetical protein FIV42_21430 [Persicimonas caeni]|uniref:Cytochrome C Planctomycete-type domain-containing protein n=1 Tax=Persicimonas caeni TaxID=2292766 RepID=A0A4Y6PY13_PERCE|nr:hypothetical protein [Persicimonas caeni]QDG53214.1 hypothetical protein FIV42_21430 [Persicimonas caeni]QED34436.1 hypothetical protein FRD00_21425 [Persicimonas caeni]